MSSSGSELVKKIRQHALRFLSRRAHSQNELERKLLQYYDLHLVLKVIDNLKTQKYLDDATLAEERALMLRSSRKWGSERIRRDLRRLGISDKIVINAIDQSELVLSSRDTLEGVIESWIFKKGEPSSVAQIKKLFDHCINKGFPAQLIRDLIGPLWNRLDS